MIINCDTTRFVWEVLEHGEYSFMFDDLVVMDLGCNVGAFSVWIYKRASIIHAVDIAIRNIDLLNKTIKDNGLGNIKTYCCAVAGATGTRMALDPSNPGEGAWKLHDKGSLAVDAYSMKDFLNKYGIDKVDVLKIDVEGAEKEILSASDFPKEKIDMIVGEHHCGDGEIESTLRGAGYSCRIYPKNHFVARRLP